MRKVLDFLSGRNVFGPGAGRFAARTSAKILGVLVLYACLVPYHSRGLSDLLFTVGIALGIGFALCGIRLGRGGIRWLSVVLMLVWGGILTLYLSKIIRTLMFIKAAGVPLYE